MGKPGAVTVDDPARIVPMPGWIVAGLAENAEDAAFGAGAALAHLHLVAAASDLPLALWRDRLALAAAQSSVAMAGRREGQGALRDAVHLTRAGDHPGPAGAIYRQWSRAVARPASVAYLGGTLAGMSPEQVALCLDAGGIPSAGAREIRSVAAPDALRHIQVKPF